MTTSQKPKLNTEELMRELRARGFSISHKTLMEGIENGVFPFVRVMGESLTGRKRFMILRSDFEDWANDRLGCR